MAKRPDTTRKSRTAQKAGADVAEVEIDIVRESDQVYGRLRNAVLEQRLPPGIQLKEQPLADAFKVNRAVVRQALAKLEMNRLVVHRPNRGVFVATPSLSESRDIFAARRAIEAAIVEALANKPTAAGMKTLRDMAKEEQAAYRDGELRTAIRLSIDFHRALAQQAGNGVLENFLEELVARTPLVVLSYKGANTQSCTIDEHTHIVDAIEARDAKRAVALMNEHILHLEKKLDLDLREIAQESDIVSLLGIASAGATPG